MVELTTNVGRADGVTLVQAVVTNTHGTPQQVRVQSLLDGPVWPPREDGFAAPGWEGDSWEMGLLPGRSRGLGFASPAEPVDPPVEVVSAERTDPDDLETAGEVLARLDDPLPPREILGGEQ